MNCREVKRLLRYNPSSALELRYELESHAKSCMVCRRELAVNRLMSTLVSAHNDFTPDEESAWDGTRMVNRIKLRIREMNERGTASWDTAIIAVRGWLIAFGATAILLLVLSTELATSSSVNQATSDNISRNNANWSEELISSNASLNVSPEEDSENAH